LYIHEKFQRESSTVTSKYLLYFLLYALPGSKQCSFYEHLSYSKKEGCMGKGRKERRKVERRKEQKPDQPNYGGEGGHWKSGFSYSTEKSFCPKNNTICITR
jgi:hypothetical protein